MSMGVGPETTESRLLKCMNRTEKAEAELKRLRVQASNYAHDRDQARAERDQAQRELATKAGVIACERERADHLQVTLDREIEQVQQLCAELAEANRRFDAAIAQRDIEIQANNRLCDELAEARQEAERMRPVVEAAKVWADRYDRGTYGMPGSSKRADYVEAIAILATAVDALPPTPEPETAEES